MDEAKSKILMEVIQMLIIRHHQGFIRLDTKSFRLFELAKQVYRADDGESLDYAEEEVNLFNNGK